MSLLQHDEGCSRLGIYEVNRNGDEERKERERDRGKWRTAGSLKASACPMRTTVRSCTIRLRFGGTSRVLSACANLNAAPRRRFVQLTLHTHTNSSTLLCDARIRETFRREEGCQGSYISVLSSKVNFLRGTTPNFSPVIRVMWLLIFKKI